ncbi:MAG TPA: DUF3108 domain-containing protein, partial [Methylophilaceae bacterium]|nr:DUF3108 domain-containing protein [Methylophilaceae bacterium]
MPRWLRGNWSRLFLALLLSLLAHLWLAGGLRFMMPEWDKADPIVVRLVNPPAKPVPPPAVAAKKPLTARPKPQPLPPPSTEPLPDAPEETTPVAQDLRTGDERSLPLEAEETLPAAQEPPIANGQSPVLATQPYILPEEEKLPPPPRHVEIDFQVLRKGGKAGVEHQKYQVADDGSYLLQSVIEPKGLLALALSDLVQKSTGTVTENGLRPSNYLYQYGRNTDKAQKADFDWKTGMVTMGTRAKQRTAELREGAQDMLSFMYQFMFVPPLQEMQLAITNG